MPSATGQEPDTKVTRKFYTWMSKVKSAAHTAEMYAHDAGLGQAFLEYQNILRVNNMVDFDDILVLVGSLPAIWQTCMSLGARGH